MYALKHTPDEGLLPSTVIADNFTLLDDEGESIKISSVVYSKGDNLLLIYPEKGSLKSQHYTLSADSELKNSDGLSSDLSVTGLVPDMEWEAAPYGVSAAYSVYRKDGEILYSLKGIDDYSASFEIINTSGTDYANLAYTVHPKNEPQVVLASGSITIACDETVKIDINVSDYIMEADDDLIVDFDFS